MNREVDMDIHGMTIRCKYCGCPQRVMGEATIHEGVVMIDFKCRKCKKNRMAIFIINVWDGNR